MLKLFAIFRWRRFALAFKGIIQAAKDAIVLKNAGTVKDHNV